MQVGALRSGLGTAHPGYNEPGATLGEAAKGSRDTGGGTSKGKRTREEFEQQENDNPWGKLEPHLHSVHLTELWQCIQQLVASQREWPLVELERLLIIPKYHLTACDIYSQRWLKLLVYVT